MNDVTIIIPIRDRDPERIRALVESLRAFGGDYSFTVADYGSAKLFAVGIQGVCERLGVRHLRLEAEGWPWNKCRAINAAVRESQTRFVVTTDVDMVYFSDPVAYCLEHHRPQVMFHVECWWIPKSGKVEAATRGGHAHPGGFQFIEREAFVKAGGYDEQIQYWGMEDWDWPWRLQRLGYEMIWLPEDYRCYHVWHPAVSSAFERPRSAFYETEKRVLSNTFGPRLSQDWGRPLPLSDRPILSDLRPAQAIPYEMTIGPDQLNGTFYQDLFRALGQGNQYVRLWLGPRVVSATVLGWKRKLLKLLFDRVPEKIGYRKDTKLNHNFEYFYSSLRILLDNGLVDYVVSQDLSNIELLFDKGAGQS